MDYHKLALSFYNSEITSHSRLIIGLAVILLALSDIALSEPLRPFYNIQYWIWATITFLVSSAFWYVLIRQLVYGVIANRLLYTEKAESFEELHEKITSGCIETKAKIIFVIPFYYFISVGKKWRKLYWRPMGYLLCLMLGLFTTFLLILLLRIISSYDIMTWINQLIS
jgi:hypothetical protein